MYPDQEEKNNQLFEEVNRAEFNLEDQTSLHSTVDIDDKNNCRPSSLKSANKHIILDIPEQGPNSSYLDTQDMEDDSSTNGSAIDQNLFISMGKSDSENSDNAIGIPKKKKKKREEESDSESEGINIKLEQFLPSIGIKKIIVNSDDESQDESKSIIKKFVEDIIILSDSD